MTKSGGFTLIELLVALALLGILGASLAGVLRNAMDSVDQSQTSLNNLTRLRSLNQVLGSALRDAVEMELSTDEQKALTESEDYSKDLGTIRFRGEELALGFCLQRPFLSTERDGYMHWILLEIRPDEDELHSALWLHDISWLPGVDNPVGDDWNGIDGSAEERLPMQTVCLVRDASILSFHYWIFPDGDTEEEPEEMEPEEIEGSYALSVPDYIELDIKMPQNQEEVFTFNYCEREGL